MNIKVKLGAENAAHYGKLVGLLMPMDLEDYVRGVVAAELGNAGIEACKAQAVAARTVALPYVHRGQPIPDDSSVQAFRAARMDDPAYANARAGTEATASEVLFYGKYVLATCAYSASNGGHTTSSAERWGGALPYLIAQDDPWDMAATGGRKTGHGVGMSQVGIKQAAMQRVSYKAMLTFYYPGTL